MKNFKVYKTTIKETGEFYIGVHSRMNPEYIGSGGLKFSRAIKNAQLNNYEIIRDDLFSYDNKEDMLNKEKELVNQTMLQNKLCLNTVLGGGNFYHTEMGAYKDKENITHFCNINDDRVLSGELVGVNSKFGIYKDKDNNIIRCSVDDDRVVNGSLHGHTTGYGIYKDTISGEIVRCSVDDSRITNGELISLISKSIPVRTDTGEILMLSLNHPDVKSGKLKHHTTGRKYIRNPKTRENKAVYIEEIDSFLNSGWELGRYYPSRKGYIFINNGEKTKNINPLELKNYLDLGWKKGKLNVKNK